MRTALKRRRRNPTPAAGERSTQRRRLRPGATEYLLLALILVGVAITLAMAILNPPG
jgi:hypothetical protein